MKVLINNQQIDIQSKVLVKHLKGPLSDLVILLNRRTGIYKNIFLEFSNKVYPLIAGLNVLVIESNETEKIVKRYKGVPRNISIINKEVTFKSYPVLKVLKRSFPTLDLTMDWIDGYCDDSWSHNDVLLGLKNFN